MKLLLKNARIYDGTGAAARHGDVLVDNDRIAQVGAELPVDGADQVLDLQGLSLAPGFIDAHSHNDWFALRSDPLPWFDPFIRQGITTFVTGNCGISTVGFDKDCPHMDIIGAGLFGFGDAKESSGSLKAYFEAADGAMPCNMAVLAGHCTSRAAVSGSVNRPLTEEEETRMLAQMEEALQQGAAGISLGLMYDPGLFAQKEELKKVAALCAKYDRPLTVHPRANSAVSMKMNCHNSVEMVKALNWLNRVFLPYNGMSQLYPCLRKHPILLPFMWVIRWKNIILHKRNRFQEYVQADSTVNDNSVKAYHEMLRKSGLDFNFE